MSKFRMTVAVLALLIMGSIPAIAQVEQQVGGQEAESGNSLIQFQVANTGNSSNQCTGALQFGTTGNTQNAQGFIQYGGLTGDVEFQGSTTEVNPTMQQVCDQLVQQAAAASG